MIRIVLLSILLLSVQPAFAQTELQQCFETCQVFAEPGYDLKKCLADCVKEYSDDLSVNALLQLAEPSVLGAADPGCETYEDACSDVVGDNRSGNNGPDDDYEPVRGDDGYDGIDEGYDGL